MNRATLVALVVVSSLLTKPALAEPDLKSQAAAELKAGRTEVALALFKQLYVQDRRPETLFNIAVCEDQLKRVTAAWMHYTLAAGQLSAANQPTARRAAGELMAATPKRITLALPPGAPPDTKVKIDGGDLEPRFLGVALPSSTPHTVAVSAPGHQTCEKQITDADQTLCLGPKIVEPEDVALEEKQGVQNQPIQPTTERSARGAGGEASSPALGIVLLGVGGVGVIVGSVFGLKAIGKDNESNSESRCDANSRCNQEGKDLRDDARSAATISTIGFGVGVVCAGIGTVLLATNKSSAPTSVGRPMFRAEPVIDRSGAGVSLRGVF